MKKNKIFVIVLAAAVLFIAATQAVYMVDMTQQVIITQLGEYIRTNTEPGLDLKVPFIQQIHRFDKRVISSDAPPAEYLTLDKKRLLIDNYTRWRIIDPLKFYKTVRNEAGALSRLHRLCEGEVFFGVASDDQHLRGVAMNLENLASHLFTEIIGDKRETIMEDVAVKSGVIVESFGIQVVDVRIKRADLPQEVQSSVFARMNAERQRIAKKYRAEGEEKARIIRARADKESTIILADANKKSKELRGQGDAEAIKIFASAFEKDPEFYAFTKSLETYSKVLDDKTVLLLDSNSDLFRYLDSPAVKR